MSNILANPIRQKLTNKTKHKHVSNKNLPFQLERQAVGLTLQLLQCALPQSASVGACICTQGMSTRHQDDENPVA